MTADRHPSTAESIRAALGYIDAEIKRLGLKAEAEARDAEKQHVNERLSNISLASLTPAIPRRGLNALDAHGVRTVRHARNKSQLQLDAIPGVGAKTIEALNEAVAKAVRHAEVGAAEAGQAAAAGTLEERSALAGIVSGRNAISQLVYAVSNAERLRAQSTRRIRPKVLSPDQERLVEWLSTVVMHRWWETDPSSGGAAPIGLSRGDFFLCANTMAKLAETMPPQGLAAAGTTTGGGRKLWVAAAGIAALGVLGLGLSAASDDANVDEAAIEAGAYTSETERGDGTSEGDGEPSRADYSTRSTTTDEVATTVPTTTAAPTTAVPPTTVRPTTTVPTTTVPPTTIPPPTLPPTTLPPTTLPPATLPPTTMEPAPLAAAADEGEGAGAGCDSNYSGCVPIASDVDCAGGSGNGPAYVAGPVRVIGSDIYDLDRDSDGYGCES